MKTEQRRGGFLFGAVLGLLVLMGCPLAVMDDYDIETRTLDIGETVISDYNLQAYVPVPVEGAVPVKAVSGRLDLDASVLWMDESGANITGTLDAFVLGAVYGAKITLTAKTGYAFDQGTSFQYYPADAVTAQTADNSPGVREIFITYKRTAVPLPIPVEELDLTGLVPAPVMGATPVTSFYAGSYGGTVVWETGGAAVTGFFQGGTVYMAKLTLYPAPGYTLAGSAFTYSLGGVLNPSGDWNNTGSALTGMTVTFPATTTVAAVVVNDLDLSYKVPAPVRGGTPVSYFSTPQYTGRVDWLVGGTPAPHNVFQANMAYTAKVTLTAASGYTFGYPAVNFTHSNAASTTVDNGNGTAAVTAVFPATTAVPAIPVNDPDLTYRIPAPVRGGTPVTYFSAPQYTGNVVWTVTSGGQPLGGLFEVNTAYTAAITLTAASGYTFEGASGAFTHAGAQIITHLSGNTVRIRFPATTAVPAIGVSDLTLTDKVSAPVRGGTPVSYFSAPEYTGSTAWSVSSGGQALGGLFEGGTAYTATVTLTAVSGYTLGGVGANAFTHSGASSVSNNAGSAVVVITFPPTSGVALTMVNDRDLTYKLPSPVREGTPVTYISAPQYTGTVDWFVGGASAPHSVFHANMTYTAELTLTAATGYTLGNPAAAFSHAGASAITTVSGAAVTVTVTFPATTSAAALTVSDLNLTSKIPAPVRNGTPAVYFSAPQYTGSVAWSVTSGGQSLDGLFGANTAYTATVTLTAASGYTFAGVAANAFTCGGASTATNEADSGVVVITFPATNTVAAIVVSDLNLTGKISVPVRGGTPIIYFSDLQYTGNVAWSVTAGGQGLNGLFEGGTAYTATVTLTAASGYTFTGVGANAFTHTGAAGAVTNPANTGVVTIAFPATGSVAAMVVSDLDLTYKLPSPVNGGTPAAYISVPQYTGTVDWSVTSGGSLSGVFGAGTAYTATVALTAASGYTFTGVGANAFTHAGGAAANAANSAVVVIAFPATGSVAAVVVSDLNLTAKVPAPVWGGTPVPYFSAPQYTGTVDWTVTVGGAALGGSLFADSTAYTAAITLSAASGYTLTGISGNFTHAGASSITADGNTGTVTIAFPATTGPAAAVVDDLNLTAKVPAPVWDGTPVTYFSTPQYTGTVDWSVTLGGPLVGLFGENTAYTATVTLTAASGYTFTGVAANTFDHTGKDTISNLGDLGAVTITFPATTGPAAAVVNDLDLTYKVARPVTAGTPTTYFSEAQYTGNVAWKRTDNNTALTGLFGANTAYTATVTLTAASGYTFTGVGANTFTHSGKSSISNAANSGVVTITFPATEGATAFTVYDLDLTAMVAVPISGGTPGTYFSEAQYTGNVAWKRTDNNTALTGLFEAGTAYTATVTLTAATGFTLTGVGANTFRHDGKSSISNAANSGVVTIAFPVTAPAPATAINSVNLTGSVPVPVTGATPLLTFNAGTYSGTMAWTTAGGTPVVRFEADTVYKAAVTLYPAAGYYFPASLPVTLGSIIVPNFTGEPRQGTVTFPETGVLLFFSGPFSGSSTGDADSAIDLIREAKAAGHSALYLMLSPRVETVSLTAGTDLGATGLVLDTGSSPVNVAIDGGRRTVRLTGTGTGSLITVKSGVTLTLRNITLISNSLVNGDLLVKVEGGGRLILETGAVMTYDVAAGGTMSYLPVEGDSTRIWEIHTFTAPGTLTFSTEAAVDYLIVAGGGGSGGDHNNNTDQDFAGGGGAGGLMYKTGVTLSPLGGAMQIAVGAGGAGGQSRQTQGADGGASAIGNIVVPGGGGGGGAYANMNGRPGGSGGGGGAGVGNDHGTAGGRSSGDSNILGNIGGIGGVNAGGSGGGAGGLGNNEGANGVATAGGLPWIAADNNAAWVSAVTGGTTEFSRGGNGGGTNAPQGGKAGVNYGDGGSAGNNRQKPGAAGYSGVVVIRFKRFNVGVP